MKKALHIIVQGRVQGVGYRWFAREAANRLNINGFVRNLPNGDVEVVAVGEEENIDQFVLELKRGPAFAYVTNMKMQPLSPDEATYDSFEVTF